MQGGEVEPCDVNGHRVVQHDGAWQGFTMSIARYLDDRLTVVVFTNLDAGNSHPERIAAHVAGLYLPALQVADSTTVRWSSRKRAMLIVKPCQAPSCCTTRCPFTDVTSQPKPY